MGWRRHERAQSVHTKSKLNTKWGSQIPGLALHATVGLTSRSKKTLGQIDAWPWNVFQVSIWQMFNAFWAHWSAGLWFCRRWIPRLVPPQVESYFATRIITTWTVRKWSLSGICYIAMSRLHVVYVVYLCVLLTWSSSGMLAATTNCRAASSAARARQT